VVQNGSNQVQVTATITNSTPQQIFPNGTTTTLALNVEQFPGANAASNFYNSTSFGYTADNGSGSYMSTNPYRQVTGHSPTIARGAYKLGLTSLTNISMNIITQQDEFVVWGTASFVPQ
jgi:hypothetical protein